MTQSFLSALLGAERPVIMEVKSRDAHGADLLRGRLPGDVAAAYQQAGAPCVSVVTGRWFGGSAAMLHEVTARVDVPVLLKDFVTRRDQITAAAHAGVSAVLLTAALLPRESLHDLARQCQAHGLTPFVEITERRGGDRSAEPAGLRRRGQQQGHHRTRAGRRGPGPQPRAAPRRTGRGHALSRERQCGEQPGHRGRSADRGLPGPAHRDLAAACP